MWLVLGKSVTEDAVSLACDLLGSRFETNATTDVAALAPSAPWNEAEVPVRAMLREQGVDLPDAGFDPYEALLRAFGFWNLPVSELEGPFYVRLPAWDEQDELQRELVLLLDQRDGASQPAVRAAIELEMRQAVRLALTSRG